MALMEKLHEQILDTELDGSELEDHLAQWKASIIAEKTEFDVHNLIGRYVDCLSNPVQPPSTVDVRKTTQNVLTFLSERLDSHFLPRFAPGDIDWKRRIRLPVMLGAESTCILQQHFEGRVLSVTDESLEIEFRFDDSSEIREYPLTTLELNGKVPQKHDRIRAVWLLEILPPSGGASQDQIEDFKREERWQEKKSQRVRRVQTLDEQEPPTPK